jgi:hypothetical protein
MRTPARIAIALVLAVVPAGGSLSAPDVLFWPARIDVATAGFPEQLRLDDLDGDGLLDLVYSTWHDPWISIQRGVPGGRFAPAPATRVPVPDVPRVAFEVADLTGDGVADLAIAAVDTLITRIGAGDGTFPNAVVLAIDWIRAFTVADIDVDGNLDIVAAEERSVEVLRGNGDGSFAPSASYPLAFAPERVVAGRLNDDAWPDLAVHGRWDDVLILLLGGDGTVVDSLTFDTPHEPIDVVLEDFDHDDRLDVAVSSRWDVDVALGLGNGRFGDPITIDSDIDAGRILPGDLDGDGNLDLVIVQKEGVYPQDEFIVVLGNGDGTFGPPVGEYFTGQVPRAMALGDTDDDGVLDLVAGAAEGYVSIFRGAGDGHFHDAGHVPSGVGTALGAGDFDRDGTLDVATEAFGRLRVHLGNGDGTFAVAESIAVDPPFHADLIHVGDADGDGRLDLVVVLDQLVGESRLATYLCVGDCEFAPGAMTSAADDLHAIGFSDFDRDGVLDALLSYAYGNSENRGMAVVPGTGDGRFGPPAWILPDRALAPLTVGDFNDDGFPDFAGGERGGFLVGLGNGDGTLNVQPPYWLDEYDPMLESVTALAVADLDEDGRADLLVGAQEFTAWHGDGEGGFVRPDEAYPCPYSHWVSAADMNADSRLDVLLISPAQTMQVLLGREGGGFDAHPHSYGIGPFPRSAAVGDLNHDGTWDIVAATGYSQGLSVLMGTQPSAPPDAPPPSRAAILSVRNPFRTQAELRYGVPVAGAASLTVYDVAGRRVRSLVEGRRLALGTYRAVWDGFSTDGSQAAAGVYFIRLEMGGTSASSTVVRVR